MAIKNLKSDPRTPEQRAADEEVLELVKAKKFFDVTEGQERRAAHEAEADYRARRRIVAAVGAELGALRRRRGLSQQQVAARIGTQKSNISRLESGRYGGLSLERFLALLIVAGGVSIEELAGTEKPGLVWWLRSVAVDLAGEEPTPRLRRHRRSKERLLILGRPKRLQGVAAPQGSAVSFSPPANLVPKKQAA
jgi:transcriptional regulator with XRE-family HTH domain